jgi:MSHA biogenesis protein MshI
MRWPWQRSASTDRMVVSWSGQSLAYVRARGVSAAGADILQIGVERQGTDSLDVFAARLAALGLQGSEAIVMLRPEQYQVLQIAAPAVPPEEVKSAARYLIREMVDMHIDDLTLDVLKVGDGQDRASGQLFVVVAPNVAINDCMALAGQMLWPVSTIDVQEMAQRNLQHAFAKRDGLQDRATAALMIVSERQALLTVVAKGELYYSRRLDLPEGFLSMEWGTSVEFFDDQPDDFAPVAEYKPVAAYTPVPDYAPVEEYVPGMASSGLDMTTGADQAASTPGQRVVVEVQRSLDLWDRTWTGLPMAGVSVYAGDRSLDLAAWLSQELGLVVQPMDLDGMFPALAPLAPLEKLTCVPLMGVLLRQEGN